MVICKYYQQGNCRYGQYCQFEHINNFGNTKAEFTEDDIAVTVAKEVLLAERGSQWLLSCFGPLRDRPCLPGMDDLSPEEVRCKIYEAQKDGTIEQAKLQFQQLCQDMKAKREALKNPTPETILMLKQLLGRSQKGLNTSGSTAGKSSAFFAAPQLSLTNSTSASNVFANKTYSNVQSNNPFGGGGFTSPSNASSIFGKTSNNPPPVFGGTATFGNNLGGFGAATNGTIFGSASTSTSSSFNSVQNSGTTFGAPPNTSIFSNAPQNVFGQSNNLFGGTSQLGNATSSSLFSNPTSTSQTSASLFGGATTTTAAAGLFGGGGSSGGGGGGSGGGDSSAGSQANSIFGAPTTSSSSFSGGMFSQPKTQLPAFGGAPVFGGVPATYPGNSGNSIFGGGAAGGGGGVPTFGAPAIPTSGIFGGSTATVTPAFGASSAVTTPAFGTSSAVTTPAFGTSSAVTTPAFGTSAAVTTSAFGAPVATTASAFDLSQQSGNNAFGAPVPAPNVFAAQNASVAISVSNSAPFGAPAAAIGGPFVTGAGAAPFADAAGFGMAVASTTNAFGATETSSGSIFASNAATTFATANGTVANASPFTTFSTANASSPFGTTNAATTPANPFAPRAQQSNSTPFGNVAPQSAPAAFPFGKPFNVTATAKFIVDDAAYSAEGSLTDDEKSMYLAEKFILGKVPFKPPTKDVR